MKIERRGFLKACAGILAGVAIAPVIPFSPALPEVVNKKEKHTKDVLTCKNFSPQITIQDYNPGAPVKWQHLSMNGDCQMCMYEDKCTCGGKKFIESLKGNCPEYWNEKLQRQWYKKEFPEKI